MFRKEIMNKLVVDLLQQIEAVEKSSKGVNKKEKISSAHKPDSLGRMQACTSLWTCSSSPGVVHLTDHIHLQATLLPQLYNYAHASGGY